MDSTVSHSWVTTVIAPEKRLRDHLYTLSKLMSSCLVDRMTYCLCGSRTITEYDVQVIKSQKTDTQKASQLIQMVIRKGRNACQLFYKCLGRCNPRLYERVTGSQAVESTHEAHHHLEEIISSQSQVPAYIININNSTLNNCIIGSNNCQHVGREQQCLLSQSSEYGMGETRESSLRSDHQRAVQDSPESHSILVESSHMEYVIIGDHSTMTVERTQEEEEEGEDSDEQAT